VGTRTLIKNAQLIDPTQRVNAVRDIDIVDGRVAAVGESLPAEGAAAVVDASGLIAVPGLVDIHCHIFYGMTSMAVDPRKALHPFGTAVAVDAGTSGSANFVNLRTFILEPSDLHLYAFLNIYVLGMAGGAGDSFRHIKGVRALDLAQDEVAAKIISRHREWLVGIKLLAPHADRDFFSDTAELLRRCRNAAELSDTRVMVHIDGGSDLSEIFGPLAGGDIVTHAFHNKDPNILGPDGKIRPEALEARSRGVIFDFAPADRHHFSWAVLEAATQQGFWPDTISTDVANPVKGDPPFATMPDCMSMLLHLSMPIEEVVRAATTAPAAAIGKADLHGSLQVGRGADVTLLKLVDEPATFASMGDGEERTVARRFLPAGLMVRGNWLAPPDGAEGG
jgi:dihydroorotase